MVFLEDDCPDNGGCIIHSSIWSMWSRQITDLMLVKIISKSATYYLHVESFHNNEPTNIFIPSWCFTHESLAEVSMELIDIMPPVATKITLQPLDSEIYHCDIVGAVSEHLSNWQILSVGTTLSVPCPELGGFLVDIFVKAIEPAETVLLRGNVHLELEESIEKVAEWTVPRPPAPSQAISSIQELSPEVEPKKTGFVPFSGKGYSLR